MPSTTPTEPTQHGGLSQNERKILWLIRRHGPMPRAELAQATGLSAQAVTNITRELIAAGLLDAEGERKRGKVGQPLRPLALAPEGALFLGLKVGRRVAELVLVDFAGQTRQILVLPHAYPHPDAIRDFAASGTAQILSGLTQVQRGRLSGMGIASPFTCGIGRQRCSRGVVATCARNWPSRWTCRSGWRTTAHAHAGPR